MPKCRITPAPSVIFTQLNGQLVLMDFETEMYFSLNSAGTDMWNALITSESLDAAMSILMAQYDVDYVTLRRDLDKLIVDLRAANLITIAEV